jgi:hypothetical protein
MDDSDLLAELYERHETQINIERHYAGPLTDSYKFYLHAVAQIRVRCPNEYLLIHEAAHDNRPIYIFIECDSQITGWGHIRNGILDAARVFNSEGAGKIFLLSSRTDNAYLYAQNHNVFTEIYSGYEYRTPELQARKVDEILDHAPNNRRLICFGGEYRRHLGENLRPDDISLDISIWSGDGDGPGVIVRYGNSTMEYIIYYLAISFVTQQWSRDYR